MSQERGKVAVAEAGSLARSLSGYLCGTHSGSLRHRKGGRLSPGGIALAHKDCAPSRDTGNGVKIGGDRWRPPGHSATLREELDAALAHPAVIELVVFGSQAREATTGFSDVDALLIIRDDAAEDPSALRSLRASVLAAQRGVLAFQPMQHHGFEVATPKLLAHAVDATGLPAEAVSESRSLYGRSVAAAFDAGRTGELARRRLQHMANRLSEVREWPRHPWLLHGTISMFELLPALYLQALGERVSKWESFAIAEARVGRARWWPYGVLSTVREAWPRRARPLLAAGAGAVRNPWLAVTVWARMPASPPHAVVPLLSADCLSGLRHLTRDMAEEATA